MSGVGFLASVKTLTPSIRRRRRCEKHHLELYREQNNVVPCWDSMPATPITPPAAFLPTGFKRLSARGEKIFFFHYSCSRIFGLYVLLLLSNVKQYFG